MVVVGGTVMMEKVRRKCGRGVFPSRVAPPLHPEEEGGGNVQIGGDILRGGSWLPLEYLEKGMWH